VWWRSSIRMPLLGFNAALVVDQQTNVILT
jgi:hypothetical protein